MTTALDRAPAATVPRIVSVGTAVPPEHYSQEELLDLFGITDRRVRSVFLLGSIRQRSLVLPPAAPDGTRLRESQGDLLDKHKAWAVSMGADALQLCLKRIGADLSEVAYLCCVTSTGFLTPGLSALLIRELGMDWHTARADIVGMGCNAGLNALAVVGNWAAANPGRLAVMVCSEACSAAYTMDATMRTAVVNSLFGDGAAAVAVVADPVNDGRRPAEGAEDEEAEEEGPGRRLEGPRILRTASVTIVDAIDAMRYDWDRDQGRFSFFLDPQVPYLVGAHVEGVVDRLLAGTSLRRDDVAHWLVHSGGKKVIDAVAVNLGLTRHDLRHTITVLRDFGNVSSGSFLFSYDRLLREGVVRDGDYGVLMTMGPGSTIESALIQW
ncbi:type III polyketide synthase [Kitasatospora xanthocidica]|uniref:Type III polyketide synthase n=1 Tax=Kitasatospora xanthocidica TaxID=83382 RepID=A0A372ZM18_9ACTN|nr:MULTISPECIES: 3,5-dihydroxyphenylacetyl-CoA synthase DpgA [Streptomycetaceae]OKI00551.1 stilbene synthase [Streptomyces sp. CB02056]RGD56480.1 type III polyketide synthase [Kitasatospora xanthocidica]